MYTVSVEDAIAVAEKTFQKGIGCDHGFVAGATELFVFAAVERAEDLFALRVGKGRHEPGGAIGLGCDRFKAGNADDGLAGHLGPGFDRREADADASERTGTRSGNVHVDIGEGEAARLQRAVDRGQKPDGVVVRGIVLGCAENLVVAKDGDAAAGVAGIEREKIHREELYLSERNANELRANLFSDMQLRNENGNGRCESQENCQRDVPGLSAVVPVSRAFVGAI